MPGLPDVTEQFVADMTAFLGPLDAAIAKADEFAQACKDAADSVAEITHAAEEMAAAVDASFASAIGSAKALDEVLAETAATMGLLSNKHVDISASVAGISGPVAGAVVQIEALKAAMAGLDSKTVQVSADVRGAGTAMTTAFGGFGRFGVGAGLLTAGNIFTVLHLAAAVLGAQLIADTIGITAFSLAASRAVGPAATAASSIANLTTQYAALDNNQKAAALSIKAFTDSLKVPDETGIFGVFYQGLALVQSELGKGNPIVTQATNAFGDFFGMLKTDLGSKAWADVFSGTTGIIRTDLDALFKLINAGIMVIPGLFHNLNFLGTAFLGAATGTLHAVAAITEWNPALTKAAALAGVAYGLYKVFWAGLGPGPGILQRAATGVGTLASRMSAGAGVAAMWAEGVGVGGVAAAAGLALGVGALAAGIGFLTYQAFHYVSATQRQIDQMRLVDGAVGNNIAGYQRMDAALQANIDKLQATGQVSQVTWGNMHAGVTVFSQGAISVGEYSLALQENQQILGNIRGNVERFGGVLGITNKQVLAAANATGVDLTKALAISSAQFAIDTAKMQGYVTAVTLSHNPLAQFKVDAQQAFNSANSLADQVRSLQAAFGALVTPQLNVIQGAINLKASEQAAAQAIAASNGIVGKQTAAQQAAGSAIITAANNALTQSANIKQMGGSAQAVIAPLQNFVSWLDSTGARGAYVAQVLSAIKQAEDALYNKTVTIAVNTISSTTYHAVTGGGPPQKKATGGTAHRGMAIVGELGPELVFMRGGEQVIPHDVTRALLSMAGQMPKITGYAGGTGGFFDKIMDELWLVFRRILDRLMGIHHRGDPQIAAIQRLENAVRDQFRDHKISKREELRLLRRLESIDDRLEAMGSARQFRRHVEAAQDTLGRDIAGLLAEFAPKHHAKVAPAIQALLNLVKKDQSQGLISDRRADRLTSWLDGENKRLEKLLTERARLAARMRTIQAFETSVSQAAQQQASLAGVISGLGGGPQSSATLLAGMQQQLAQIRRFDADIKKLSKLGLDKALINQIIQMGPAQGSQVAEALINGPLANIAALNKTETQVQQASRALGNTAATAVYGSGKDFGKNFLKGLRSQEKAIEAEMAKIAKDMVDVLEDALGLHGRKHRRHKHHPHHSGAAFMAELAAGMTDSTGAGSAARAAAGFVPSALGSAAAGISGGSAIRLDLTIHNYTEVDGKELYKSVQQRSLRIDRRNGRNNLSLTAGRRR